MPRSAPHERYLPTGEVIVLEVRRHWASLLAPALKTTGLVLACLAVGFVTSPNNGSDPVDTVASWVGAAAIGYMVFRFVEWRIDRFVVTDHRIVEVAGIITRRVSSLPIGKVTDMTYQRSPLARLLGYGELVLESAGQKQALDRIDYLPHPDDFYRSVTYLVNQTSGSVRSEDRVDTGELPLVPE
jgi:uncharacterized membrane protein YdbT with pleckstrin-like domain